MPRFEASRATASAATVAANGVDFFEPLKPARPALPHAITSPFESVIVICVLLKVALMCATPSDSTARRLLLVRPPVCVGFAMFSLQLYFFGGFFLPAIARREPLCVRAFVCVRCPRTGRPRRCRVPR